VRVGAPLYPVGARHVRYDSYVRTTFTPERGKEIRHRGRKELSLRESFKFLETARDNPKLLSCRFRDVSIFRLMSACFVPLNLMIS